jgi:hypothetical protein
VEGRLLLDVVVRKGAAVLELLAGEDETLLVRGDALLVLDLLGPRESARARRGRGRRGRTSATEVTQRASGRSGAGERSADGKEA